MEEIVELLEHNRLAELKEILIKLMKDAREAIKEKRFKEFKEKFIQRYEGK